MLAMLVTVPILIYQIIIGAMIVGAGALFGRTGAKWGAVIAAVWTLTHVIFPPLMCLQFVTITAATAVAFAIAKRRPPQSPPQPQQLPDEGVVTVQDYEVTAAPDDSDRQGNLERRDP